MAIRRGVILALVVAGGVSCVYGTPPGYRSLTIGALLFALAFIYARLTQPKGLMR